MTAPRLPERDGGQVDALVADRYLDALLDAVERRAADTPADAALDPDLREAARVLRRTLVRVHPSFRFEERLAGRLADLAAAQSGAALDEAVAGGRVIPFPAAAAPGAAAAAPLRAGAAPRTAAAAPLSASATVDPGLEPDPLLAAILAGDLDPADEAAMAAADPPDAAARDRRPLIVAGGAAITSAAISLVGVAYVAWRASRPDRPMGRAARTAHARRAAALAGASLGGPA